MSRRGLTVRLGAVERRGRGPRHPPVRWVEAVRPGEDGRQDEARRAGAAMRALVQGELAAVAKDDVLLLIMTSVVTNGEGVAEAGGRRWRLALAHDGAGGTAATVTGREVQAWVG